MGKDFSGKELYELLNKEDKKSAGIVKEFFTAVFFVWMLLFLITTFKYMINYLF